MLSLGHSLGQSLGNSLGGPSYVEPQTFSRYALYDKVHEMELNAKT